MRELRPDPAAVNFLQEIQDVPEFHALVAGTCEPAGVELGFHVGVGEPEVVAFEHAGYRALHKP
jgi:hypothetical protein